MSKFVHLHSHTEYSLLDGLSKIKKMVKKAKELNMEAMAITDHGNMYGAIEFYKSCKDAGIKPIIGCELYVAKRNHTDKEAKLDSDPYHLIALAKNYEGYRNLMKLVSIAQLDGFYYRPRVDKELLRKYHEGLIFLSACPGGEFIKAIESGGIKKAEEVAKEHLEIFGEGNFYLELQNHEYRELIKQTDLPNAVRQELEKMADLQDKTWDAAKEISKKLGIPMVATNDFHYINKDDAEAQDALVCVQTGKLLTDLNRLRMIDTPNLYIRTGEEMERLFKDIPEAIASTTEIANKCDLEIPLGTPYFPIYGLPEGKTPAEVLRELCYEKFTKMFPDDDDPLAGGLKERLDYELSVIEKKKYPTYFLVTQDFINWAHEQGIITNTRGSAAGSLVLHVLGITDVNPIEYKLPFERFLNPLRPSLPDIDNDLADDRRDDVIRYVMDKYGQDKVAHIITFGTMMGRAAIRDIGRVMGMAYGDVDRIAKLVPPPYQGFHKPLEEAIKEVPELFSLYKSNPQVKKLLDLAMKVEGTVRHASVHAAGVVIAPEPLTNFVPLQKEANGDKVVIQYEMGAAEEVGLVKMDFLGIRNLSILGHAVKIVQENRNIDIQLNKIPLDDPKPYELLSKGETMGLFQLEGEGMTKYIMELKPTNIFDIMAMIALYRPGPISVIPEYIARKRDPSKITYFDPRMEEYLGQSKGLLVYQDDVLYTAINISGYNWEEVDKFRKAMGKKNPAEMAKQKDHFIEGAIERGMKKEKAEDLFKLIEPFAAYGFNKAHAASYAMVSYQTAYMKANYPVEFMAAVMTAESGDAEKIAHAIEECKRLGIVVMPPDINKSEVGFSIEKLDGISNEELQRSITGVPLKKSITNHGIRFGLSAIKNVGVSAINSILAARKNPLAGGGEFRSLADVCSRVDARLVNRKTLESLIKAGAFDNFGNRSQQLAVLDQILIESHKKAKQISTGQVSFFDGFVEEEVSLTIELPNIDEMPMEQLLTFEKELLGFYLHEPIFVKKLREISAYVSCKVSEISDEHVERRVTIGGVITEAKRVLTKKTASEMAFIKISDGISYIEAVIFPKIFDKAKHLIERDQVVIVDGKVDKREDSLSLLVDTINIFDPAKTPKMTRIIEIEVPKGTDAVVLQQVNKMLRQYPGEDTVNILLPGTGNNIRRMVLPFSVRMQPELEAKIKELLGDNMVKMA